MNTMYLNIIDRFRDEQRHQHRRMASLEERSDKLDAYFNDLKEENLVSLQPQVCLWITSSHPSRITYVTCRKTSSVPRDASSFSSTSHRCATAWWV